MMRRPPVSTRSDTLFPVTTLCRSIVAGVRSAELGAAERDLVGTGRARRPRHPLGRKAHRPARGAPPRAYVAQPLRPLVLLHVMVVPDRDRAGRGAGFFDPEGDIDR